MVLVEKKNCLAAAQFNRSHILFSCPGMEGVLNTTLNHLYKDVFINAYLFPKENTLPLFCNPLFIQLWFSPFQIVS